MTKPDLYASKRINGQLMPAYTPDNYASIARFYDAFTSLALAAPRRVIADMAMDFFAMDEKKLPVLDIGCGTGLQLLELLRAGLPCVGVDASAAMLARASLNREREIPALRPYGSPSTALLGSAAASAKPCSHAGPTPPRLITPPSAAMPTKQPQPAAPVPPYKQATPTLPPFALLQAGADTLPFADKTFGLSVLSLLLHESEAPAFALLDEALRVSRRALVMDWRMPERNLDYPLHCLVRLLERCAGGRHYKAFCAFMRQGGLEGLLRRYELYRCGKGLPGGQVSARLHLAGGCLLLLQVEAG